MNRVAIAVAAILVGTALFGSAQARQTGAPPEIRLEAIEARLIYQTSGALSENVAPPSDFALWNTVIGEGSAAEPATDFLVQVRLATTTEQANATDSLIVTVRDAQGKVMASRRFEHVFLDEHRAIVSLQVTDATCAGPVTIEARFGRQTRTARIDFACGE